MSTRHVAANRTLVKRGWVRLVLVLAAIGLFLYGLTPDRAHAATASMGNGSSVATGGSAAPPDPASVKRLFDEIVPKLLAEHKIPGAAVSVVAGGRQVFAGGYGVSDVPNRKPVDPARTAFFMGSDAKVFTAVAVLQQVRAGKLDLHADVNRYLTAFKIRDSYPGHPVTVENLLTHTGGFDDTFMGLAEAEPQHTGGLGAALAAHQPDRVRAPGVTAAYDNYGVALAGYLVEVVSGQPFDQYVAQHVLRPLGMDRTTFTQPHPAPIDADLAHGYRPDGDGQTETKGLYGPLTPTGAAAVTTVDDMGRLMLAQLNGGAIEGRSILDQEGDTLLLARHFGPDQRMPGMAYLLEQRDRNGRQLLVKDGDVPGFHSNLALLPAQGVGLYVTVNGDGEDATGGWTTQQVLNAFVDRFYPAAGASPAVVGGELSKFTGDFRSTRVSHSNLTKAAALMGSVHIAARDGRLVVSGPVTRDPSAGETQWEQVQPGLFQQVGGTARIAFELDGDGEVTSMLTDSDPTIAYEPLAWYQAPELHQRIALGSLALLALTVIGWGVAAVVRAARGAGRAGQPAARLLGWLTGAVLVVATGCFALLTSDSNALNQTLFLGDSPLLQVVPAMYLAAAGLTLLMVVCAVVAWRRGWWGVFGRLHYTGVTVAALLVLVLAGGYDLIGTGQLAGSLDLIG
ncbi:serine hydrolase domain-containing protein [Kitasatospora cathayae]|uniref:Serine hydrolase n=1 Tax=Kitasatospora cathayae TaxID=3004092 RepID=A0ABY7Q4R9_9ACTN|nr:serine hydrolase domain-containing protein [Kitasatospora sp. HUAS 3-15]WBP87692.1 serine hydrolase [Kitasatospora sp. HUAS 3-15]